MRPRHCEHKGHAWLWGCRCCPGLLRGPTAPHPHPGQSRCRNGGGAANVSRSVVVTSTSHMKCPLAYGHLPLKHRKAEWPRTLEFRPGSPMSRGCIQWRQPEGELWLRVWGARGGLAWWSLLPRSVSSEMKFRPLVGKVVKPLFSAAQNNSLLCSTEAGVGWTRAAGGVCPPRAVRCGVREHQAPLFPEQADPSRFSGWPQRGGLAESSPCSVFLLSLDSP